VTARIGPAGIPITDGDACPGCRFDVGSNSDCRSFGPNRDHEGCVTVLSPWRPLDCGRWTKEAAVEDFPLE
jgi:hypothetical protein